MARKHPSSTKSGNSKSDDLLKTDQRHPKKSTGSSDASHMSSHSYPGFSTGSAWNPASTTQCTSATSWTSHDGSHPWIDMTHTNPGISNELRQVGVVNYDNSYMSHGAGPDLLHIGAQFYGIIEGGPQVLDEPVEWNARHSNQAAHTQSMIAELGPNDGYRRETFIDRPYTYLTKDVRVYGGGIAKIDNMQSTLAQITKWE